LSEIGILVFGSSFELVKDEPSLSWGRFRYIISAEKYPFGARLRHKEKTDPMPD